MDKNQGIEVMDLEILQNDGNIVWAAYTVWSEQENRERGVLVVWDDKLGAWADAQGQEPSPLTAAVQNDRRVQEELSELAAFQRKQNRELH